MGRSTISAVGDLLREWRGVRGMSQLDLALTAGVSSRHISFVETGRSQPSREMVLRLAETLELPLRERNSLLVAAGFAPAYARRRLDHERLAPVRQALEWMLRAHEPYPAFVLDRAYNILMSNRVHQTMLPTLLPAGADPGAPVNVMRLVLHPDLLRPRMVNWEVVAYVLGHRLRRQIRLPGTAQSDDATEHAALRELFEEYLAYPGVEEAMARPPSEEPDVFIPMEFDVGEGRCHRWFSTIATIGTPQDVTVEELRIESLFPADATTAREIRAWVDEALSVSSTDPAS